MRNRNAQIEELLKQIASGDTASMGVLYDLIKTDLFAYALSRVGNKTDADDITQDTFLQIYRHAKQYAPQGKPMAWVITVENNLIRRLFHARARTVSLDGSTAQIPAEEDTETSVIDSIFLRDLMRTLSSEEREIISLHIVSGMKHREIAALLDKPLSTILSKYNRAIKKLQSIVKEGK